MAEPDDSLVVEEYKAFRELIKANIELVEKNETFALGAIGATIAFVLPLLREHAEVVAIAKWVPLVIAVLGVGRFVAFDRTIHEINLYLDGIQQRVKVLCFAHAHIQGGRHHSLFGAKLAVWIVAAIASGIFGCKA